MEFYDASFFSDGSPPIRINFVRIDKDIDNGIVLSLNRGPAKHSSPVMHFYLSGEQEFVYFKNSVIQAYEDYRRKR